MLENAIMRPGIINRGSCIDNDIANFHASNFYTDIFNIESSDHHAILYVSMTICCEGEVKQEKLSWLYWGGFLVRLVGWVFIGPKKKTMQAIVLANFQTLKYMWTVNITILLKRVGLKKRLLKSTVNCCYTTELQPKATMWLTIFLINMTFVE